MQIFSLQQFQSHFSTFRDNFPFHFFPHNFKTSRVHDSVSLRSSIQLCFFFALFRLYHFCQYDEVYVNMILQPFQQSMFAILARKQELCLQRYVSIMTRTNNFRSQNFSNIFRKLLLFMFHATPNIISRTYCVQIMCEESHVRCLIESKKDRKLARRTCHPSQPFTSLKIINS